MICRECFYISDNKDDFHKIDYNCRQKYQDTYICNRCFENNNYQQCELCKDSFPINIMKEREGKFFCYDCYANMQQCEHCNKYNYIYDIIFNNSLDKYICRKCFDELGCFICCGRVLNGGETCSCKCDSKTQKINEAQYQPNIKFFKMNKDADNLFMGVELEVGGAESEEKVVDFVNNVDFDLFYFKKDISIPDYGVEIVTHPATLTYHKSIKSHWKNVLNRAIKRGLRGFEHKECGIHIHVNKNIFSQDECAKIDLFINNYEKLFRKISRRKSSYAKYYQKKSIFIGRYDGDRYTSVNFANNDTIEFRIFRSTMKYKSLMATLELTHAICNFVKLNEFDLFVCKKNETILNFVNYIANNNYDYVIDFLKENKIIEIKENNTIVVKDGLI